MIFEPPPLKKKNKKKKKKKHIFKNLNFYTSSYPSITILYLYIGSTDTEEDLVVGTVDEGEAEEEEAAVDRQEETGQSLKVVKTLRAETRTLDLKGGELLFVDFSTTHWNTVEPMLETTCIDPLPDDIILDLP